MTNTTLDTQSDLPKPSVALFVKTFSQYGGVENFCYRLREYLRARGFKVMVFCGEDKSDLSLEGLPNAYVQVMNMWRPGRFLKNLSLFFKARAALSSLPEGTVSICFGNMAGCTIYRSGGPHIDFMTRSMKAQRTTSQKISKLLKRFFAPINWLMPILDVAVYSDPKTKCIIAISSKVEEAIAEAFPQAKKKISVIPNGVNMDRFSTDSFHALREDARIWYSLRSDQKAIGFCSTNFELKGLDRLISALPLLPPHYILIAAGGRNHAKYIEQAVKLGVEDRVIFPGKVDNMPKFYAALDVFCHPSFYDTFGSVVAEALAMGIPTITTEDVGACDLIKNGVNGFVVADPTPELLSKAIWDLRDKLAGNRTDTVRSDEEIFARYEQAILLVAAGASCKSTTENHQVENND